MTMTYRAVTDEDLPAVVRLMNRTYARQKTAAYFQWQYAAAPSRAGLYGAFRGAELVGTFGMQMKRLTNGAACGQAMDMVVAPEVRRHGVFRALAAQALEAFRDLELCCVFANAAGRGAVEHGLGWTVVAAIPAYVWSADGPTTMTSSGGGLTTAAAPGPRRRVAFEYPADYAAWRFARHPEYAYWTVPAAAGGSAVLKLFTDPMTQEVIGDIVHWTEPSGADDLAALLHGAVASLRQRRVRAITTWAPARGSRDHLLRQCGFQPRPQTRYFCVQVQRPALRALETAEAWRWEQADTDVY